MTTYAIHESYFPAVEKKINRVIRKCEKYGNPFTFEVIGEEMRRDSRAMLGDPSNKYNDVFHKFILVDVEGTAVVGEWEFVATLDMRESGNVIRRYNTEVELPEYYKTSPNVCDHCRTARDRKNLYVVRNLETGEFKQVGGNCLMSYSGINLEYAAALMDGIDHLCSYDNLYDNDFGFGGTRYYPVSTIISYAATIVGKVGYFNADYRLSTRSMVSDVLFESNIRKGVSDLNIVLKDNYFNVQFTESDFTADNSEQVNAIIDYYKSLDDRSEFVHNIQTIISGGYASYKDLGYLCYTPQGYAKHLANEVERAKRNQEIRDHWGEVGKRYKNVKVEDMRRVAAYNTDFGVMNIWQIIIEGGIVLTWKSSVYPEGEFENVSFTIKEHSEYKGTKQTIVTRCKFAA